MNRPIRRLRRSIRLRFPAATDAIAHRALRSSRLAQAEEHRQASLLRAAGREFLTPISPTLTPETVLQNLEWFELQVRSQNGEDGVLRALSDAFVLEPHRSFEIGVEYGRECNTRALAELRGWSTVLVDGDATKLDIGRSEIDAAGLSNRIRMIESFVTPESIDGLIERNGESPLGLLSIDVDGVDYWLWEACSHEPPLVVVEYNASLGPTRLATAPNESDFVAKKSGEASLFHGASISALASLAERKGYALVYCESTGANAFFLRLDMLPAGFQPRPAADLWRPHRHRSVLWSQAEQERICTQFPFVSV